MIAWVNGAFVADGAATLPVTDRGFCLGDGLFETLTVRGGVARHFSDHWRRFAAGLEFFGIERIWADEGLLEILRGLGERNGLVDAVVRVTVSRGPGPRGYAPRGAGPATCVVTMAPMPQAPVSRRLLVSRHRVFSEDPLLRFKTLSRALNVLAAREATLGGLDDAIFLNERGEFAEATGSNVFFLVDGRWRTPPLASGVLPGVTRARILRTGALGGVPVEEGVVLDAELERVTSVCLTNSVGGVVPVAQILAPGRDVRFDSAPPLAI